MYMGKMSQNNEVINFYKTRVISLPTPMLIIMWNRSSHRIHVEESILKFIYVHASFASLSTSVFLPEIQCYVKLSQFDVPRYQYTPGTCCISFTLFIHP